MNADLLYSDTEEALRDSVRRLLADRCPPEAVMRLYDPAPPDFSGVWKELAADLGVAGLLVPDELGGAGAGAREAAVVMEEIGRAVAPVPFLSSAVLATIALLTAGDTETLPALAAGELTAALVVPLSTAPGDAVAGVTIGNDGLAGEVTGVAGVAEADVLVVPAAGPDGLGLHTVSRAATGVEVSPVLALDMTRSLAHVRFSGVPPSRVATGSAEAALAAALQTGTALLASEQLGVAQWCFDTTLKYIKGRKQFARTIGSYQAIKHRMADLWLEVSSAAAAARYAADTCARRDPDAAIAATIAQAYCSDAAVHAAEECIQLHGGIGMTWDYPAHLYLKRAKSDQLALGTGYRHRARLAELVDLPAT
ncbi:acyl-CoA dehydrogenase [Mycobacterium heckeshornense]|uniref:Acyl-CoA dehydrogenase n=1 Tax=Mycobacterium heckeshornense TaxID=110505 RepID=A0A2G8B4A6_9MYCO|nr:acyl-CoA dehydrogenase family protein [Mycobacterium heckeshornense]KMV22465.1 acyl-CoA dehydrogenase [Mycobacterium heckeshornense]MCV7034706.1 acyl-CoA/acyl-ACP dehydrogenase [Mycobacterium heckeshornense]PIJ32587.1 acyl-CoA dehydrogenase [Mycobacterium heckeshornense]BCO36834.1 acyl-CoA dehydrogenase [Mycobacterium heckeshornense]BCQ09737.1 acyl-CoA dehydrogenase [Mycobacterium heckeshornense]